MKRRTAVMGMAGLAFAPMIGRAQQGQKLWRIGVLLPGVAPPSLAGDAVYGHFVKALAEQGYAEGKNLRFEVRSLDGKYERAAPLAEELVLAKVDLILAATPPSVQAVKRATTTIPIVMVAVGDPVALGFVASYARPGGNVTGVSNAIDDVSSKYLELLRAANPKLQRVAVLVNPDNPNVPKILGQIQASAKIMKMDVMPMPARTAEQISEAIPAASQRHAQALIVQADGFFFSQRQLIVDLTTKHRMASIWWTREAVEIGALMSYGQNAADDYRKVARYVVRILTGTKPADLPVEQPTHLKFTLNRKTAAALGLSVTQELLLRADDVIE